MSLFPNLYVPQELLAARKRAKKDMKNAPTEFEKAVQNGRQVSIDAISRVYGACAVEKVVCMIFLHSPIFS